MAATPRKRYVLRSLAIVLLLFAGAAFFLEPHNLLIRSFGVLAILVSVQLSRTARTHDPGLGGLDLAGSNGPGRLMWFVGIASLLLAGLSSWFLYIDSLHGSHAVWPVYMFAGVALACIGVWSYIASKLS